LFRRDGVYYADGRVGAQSRGKHSLNTRDEQEARDRLHQLDHHIAVQLGLTSEIPASVPEEISIVDGWTKYLDFCGRGSVLGGVSPATLKRYRAVRDKHQKFCSSTGINSWLQFDRHALERYGRSLEGDYAPRTVYLELTLLKSISGWLVREQHLPAAAQLQYALRRPQGTDEYCYTVEQVTAMVEYCERFPNLSWLKAVIIGLSHTGLRISELANLRWSDISFDSAVVTVADERASPRRTTRPGRTTKGRRSRHIPLHPELQRVLAPAKRAKDGYVFRAVRGGRLRPNNVLADFKKKIIKPLAKNFPTCDGDIGFEQGTLHSFRHYFCTQTTIGRAAEGEIKAWLGHADSKMVDHYRHLRVEDGQRRMSQIEFLASATSRSSDGQ
jgi:integrase